MSGTHLLMFMLHPYSARANANQAHLRIMATTDLHVHVFPYDYYADHPSDHVGLARVASIIAAIRAEAANALLVDNGDFLQGSPMGDYIAYERGMKEGDMHPIITAMNAVGYDAATIGNHEFNYGIGFLEKSVAGGDFPLILANVAKKLSGRPTKDKTLFKPYVILDRQLTDGGGQSLPIKIGIIGFTPPQIMTWDHTLLHGHIEARDIVDTARAYVPEIKEQGADIIIALSHSGIGPAKESEGMENASVPLAGVDEIDAVVTGHSHLVFPSPTFANMPAVDVAQGTIHGKPAVMGGFWGNTLGIIDLMLERDGGTWQVANYMSDTRAIAERQNDKNTRALVASDDTVLQSVADVHEQTLSYVRRPVGQACAPIHSYFAMVTNDPSLQIVADAQRWYLRQMLFADADDGLPILSAVAPFKTGGRSGPDHFTDVPAGDLAIKNIADIYVYPNRIRAVKITGAELLNWLERSAGVFNQLEQGTDQPLLNDEFPNYNFDVMDGVQYQIDLSQPSRFDHNGEMIAPTARRIKNLTYRGQAVRPDMEFVVATNNYRVDGGGAFPGVDGTTTIFESPDASRDVIVRYVTQCGVIDPMPQHNWSFVPLKGAAAQFRTGQGARQYLKDVAHLQLTDLGNDADGFAVFRLML